MATLNGVEVSYLYLRLRAAAKYLRQLQGREQEDFAYRQAINVSGDKQGMF